MSLKTAYTQNTEVAEDLDQDCHGDLAKSSSGDAKWWPGPYPPPLLVPSPSP